MQKKNYYSKSNLREHIKRVHEKVLTEEWPKCHKVFYNKADLKTHDSRVHQKRKDFKCNICDKTFFKLPKFKFHLKNTQYKIRDFCCDKYFHTVAHLRRHFGSDHERTRYLSVTFVLKGLMKALLAWNTLIIFTTMLRGISVCFVKEAFQ